MSLVHIPKDCQGGVLKLNRSVIYVFDEQLSIKKHQFDNALLYNRLG